jgi:hypothetical protein
MRIYFSDSRMPELAALPPDVARAVLRRALDQMGSESKLMSWLPTILCGLGCPFGSYAGAWLGCVLSIAVLPLGPGQTSVLCIPGMVVGGFVAGFIGKQIQASRLRACIRRTIDDCVKNA